MDITGVYVKGQAICRFILMFTVLILLCNLNLNRLLLCNPPNSLEAQLCREQTVCVCLKTVDTIGNYSTKLSA